MQRYPTWAFPFVPGKEIVSIWSFRLSGSRFDFDNFRIGNFVLKEAEKDGSELRTSDLGTGKTENIFFILSLKLREIVLIVVSYQSQSQFWTIQKQ